MRKFVATMLGSLALSRIGAAQLTDWNKLFRDLTSHDSEVSAAARKVSFDTLIPTLQTEGMSALVRDIEAIAPEFQGPEDIRLQASGLLTTLAELRPDGTAAFRTVLPIFIAQFHDKTPRIRRNAVMAVVNLRPQVPDAALPSLIAISYERDDQVSPAAMVGVARCAETSAEAVRALKQLFSPEETTETKRNVTRAVGEARVTNTEIIEEVRKLLGSPDRLLVRSAIDALGHIGPAAIGARGDLQNLLANGADDDLKQAATGALARISR